MADLSLGRNQPQRSITLNSKPLKRQQETTSPSFTKKKKILLLMSCRDTAFQKSKVQKNYNENGSELRKG